MIGDPSATGTPALRPRPATTADTAFFWRGARSHTLLVQQCGECGVRRHPPTAACHRCGSLEWHPVRCGGHGRVFSFTVLHEPLPPPFSAPHIGVVVELDEGVRIVSELVGVSPGDVTIGMDVMCEWLDCDADLTVPRFRPT